MRRRYRIDARLPGWERRLAAWLQAQRDIHYDWRRHCLIFCAGAVRAVTGKDLARGRRGRASTKHGALRRLKALGFDSPAALIDSLLPARAPGFARRGDLVMDADGIPGVCLGDRAAYAGPEGLAIVPGRRWVRAWTVGER